MNRVLATAAYRVLSLVITLTITSSSYLPAQKQTVFSSAEIAVNSYYAQTLPVMERRNDRSLQTSLSTSNFCSLCAPLSMHAIVYTRRCVCKPM